jgi:hypothetical protein
VQPDDVDDGNKTFALNSASPVGEDEYGKCVFGIDAPVWGRIESDSGNSTWDVTDTTLDWVGQEWGPVDGRWDVNIGGTGFIIQGPPDIANNRILVRQKSTEAVEPIPGGSCTCCPGSICYPASEDDITDGCAAVPCLVKNYMIVGSFPFSNIEPIVAYTTGCEFESDPFEVEICGESYGNHYWLLTVGGGRHDSTVELVNDGGTDIPLDFEAFSYFLPFHGNEFDLKWDCGLVDDDTLKSVVRQWPPKICVNPIGSTDCVPCEIPPVSVCGCDVDVNASVEFSAAGCAALDGLVVPLIATGTSPVEWSGDFLLTGCGTLTFFLQITPDCNVYMWIEDEGVVKWGNDSSPGGVLIDCAITPAGFEYSLATLNACAIPPLSCSGNMTATVTLTIL